MTGDTVPIVTLAAGQSIVPGNNRRGRKLATPWDEMQPGSLVPLRSLFDHTLTEETQWRLARTRVYSTSARRFGRYDVVRVTGGPVEQQGLYIRCLSRVPVESAS